MQTSEKSVRSNIVKDTINYFPNHPMVKHCVFSAPLKTKEKIFSGKRVQLSYDFAEKANKFLYERGYNKYISYFIGGTYLDFYPEYFYADNDERETIHPNGKKFNCDILSQDNYEKYKEYMCELLKPLMKEYGIIIDNIR